MLIALRAKFTAELRHLLNKNLQNRYIILSAWQGGRGQGGGGGGRGQGAGGGGGGRGQGGGGRGEGAGGGGRGEGGLTSLLNGYMV